MLSIILVLIFSYLMGTLQSGVLVAKILKKTDPRTAGSGNIGATNMGRLNGSTAAIATFILDGLKGLIPVAIAYQSVGHKTAMLAGLAAVLGHMFPAWSNFKGGKGVATAVFIITAMNYKLGVLLALTWIMIFTISGYSSLASLVALWAATITSLLFAPKIFILNASITALVFWRHSNNIRNLLNNKEDKFQTINKFVKNR